MNERTAKRLAELQRVLREQVNSGTTYEGYLLVVAGAVREHPELAEAISDKGRIIIDALLTARGLPALFATPSFEGPVRGFSECREDVRDAPTPQQIVADLLARMGVKAPE